MDSSRPPSLPPASFGPRKLRPRYLVATMVLTWFIGVHGLTTGCSTLMFLRRGNVTDIDAAAEAAKNTDDPMQVIAAIHEAARMQAMSEIREITFPLGAAKVLLAALLVVASALAMAGRPGARSLALQALAANAILAAVDYALTKQVRAAWIEAVARSAPKLSPEQALLVDQKFWWWVERVRFAVFDLGTLCLAALALTRQRTRSYFEAAREAAETIDEP